MQWKSYNCKEKTAEGLVNLVHITDILNEVDI